MMTGKWVYETKTESLLVVGDLIHSAAVQFPRPDVAVSFDSDPKQAVAARQALFRRAAEDKSFIAGMHLPFPGIGRLRADGKGGYVWVPVEYSTLKKG
jgi:glyoxylase-like metal-dependent hydrolase (beta-lactamase superfamily II)